MSGNSKEIMTGESLATTEPDKAARKAARVAVRGYMNGNAVEFALLISNVLTDALKKLAIEKPTAQIDEVFLAVTTALSQEGLAENDSSLVALGAVLGQLNVGKNELLAIAAHYKKREKEKGLFAKLLRKNLHHVAPALFILFNRIKDSTQPNVSQELINLPRIKTANDVIAVLCGTPSDNDSANIQNFLKERELHRKDVDTKTAQKLLDALNDPTQINIGKLAPTVASPWHFLWKIRTELWQRDDLIPKK